MSKFNVNINGKKIEMKDDEQIHIGGNEESTVESKSDNVKGSCKTVINQTVVQHGEHNYNFDKAPEGLHIGDTYTT